MPMNFPDMDSLRNAAQCHGFRKPHNGEGETVYRIESLEVRADKGWYQWRAAEGQWTLLDTLERKL